MQTQRVAFLFILPAALVVLTLVSYPLGYAFWLSLTNETVGSASQFIGFENYVNIFLDATFRRSIVNTLVFSCVGLIFKLVLGLIMALALNRIERGRSLISGVLLLPWIIPTVISTLVWKWMFDSETGVMNYVLLNIHLMKEPIAWLGTGTLAMTSLITVAVWREIPYFGISLLAGLKGIEREQYEVAAIEGASTVQTFRFVTLPNLRNMMLLVSVLSAVQSAYDFAIIWILTGGGPVNATDTFSTLSFEKAILDGNIARAIAIALAAFPIIAPVIILTARHIELQEA